MFNYILLSEILKDDSDVQTGLKLTREKNNYLVKETGIGFPVNFLIIRTELLCFQLCQPRSNCTFFCDFSNSLASWGIGNDLDLFQEIPVSGLDHCTVYSG